MITGLGAYREADQPIWYDSLPVEQRWDTQALFWRTAAAKVAGKGSVFAYNLMNEPKVSACPEEPEPCDWLVGEPFGGEFHFIQNITIEPDLPRHDTMAAWIDKLTQAIRMEDKRTLITLGTLYRESLPFLADQLDFVSPHVYPISGDDQEMIDYIRAGADGAPLVIGETFSLSCSCTELGDFLHAVDGSYQGFFGHYMGLTPDELADRGDDWGDLWHEFLLFFVANNPNTQEAQAD